MINLNDPEIKAAIERQRHLREALKRVELERHNQDKERGGDEHDDMHSHQEWIIFIIKQLGRAAAEKQTLQEYKDSMIKVAALAVASYQWAERAATK